MNPATPEKGRAVGRESFLRDLYVAGRLDREFLESFTVDPLGDEAAGVVAIFEALAERYPARVLEVEGRIPEEGLAEMAEAGLFGLSIPVEYGGLGLSVSQYLHVVRRVAPVDLSLALASLAHLSIGVQPVVLYGTDEQKARYLERAARGETIFAYALTEPATGSDAKHIETTARLSTDGTYYTLEGRKTYITNANYAGAFTVFARIDGAPEKTLGAFVVERGWEGLSVGPDMPKMGLKASSTAFVALDGVRVPVENRLGDEGDGFPIALTVLNYGRLAVCAAAVGLMERSVADMVKRATGRRQFGVPIASFELVQEKIAAGRVGVFVAESMVAFAARQLERDPAARVAVETSHCKYFCTTRAWQTLYDAQQVAGGSGYLATNPYEKRLRDFRVATIFEGTTEIHSIYPALLLARAVARRLPRTFWRRLLALHQGAWARLPPFHETGQRLVDGALTRVRRSFRGVRFRLRLALVLHGKGLAAREFSVRRITRMSVHAYGLMAAALRFDADRTAGRAAPEGLDVLAAFSSEVRRLDRDARRVFDSREERLQVKIAERVAGHEVGSAGVG